MLSVRLNSGYLFTYTKLAHESSFRPATEHSSQLAALFQQHVEGETESINRRIQVASTKSKPETGRTSEKMKARTKTAHIRGTRLNREQRTIAALQDA